MKALAVSLAVLILGCMAWGHAGSVGEGSSGTLVADSIEVRWQTTEHPERGPELSILSTNIGDSFARIRFLWSPRICDGVVYEPLPEDIRAVVKTLGGSPPMRELRPSEWVVISFPLTLRFQQVAPRDSFETCETRIELHIHRKGQGMALAELVVPAPPPRGPR